MIEWFASHNGIEQLFLLSGIVGGIILLFRMILMIVGLAGIVCNRELRLWPQLGARG